MSYHVSITSSFITKTKEQAEYIEKFFKDAESLMCCQSSASTSTEIVETERVSA